MPIELGLTQPTKYCVPSSGVAAETLPPSSVAVIFAIGILTPAIVSICENELIDSLVETG